MGVATHMQSEQDASKVAMLDCQLKGGGNCKIEATYDNQCVAVVTGDSGHNAPNAATVARATEIGMKTCRDSGDTNCRVYYSVCSLPARIR